MSDGGWTRTPRAVWHAAVAGIAGPWPKEVREHDLVVWDEARIYEGTARPSGRELAARWGVSHAVARRDIERHEGGAQRGHTKSTERAHQEHREGTERAQPTKLDATQNDEKGTERAQRGHREGTERAQRGHKGGSAPPNNSGSLVLFQALETEKEKEKENRDTDDAKASYVAPDWWPKVKLPEGCVREQFRVAVVEAVKACRGTPPQGRYPAKADAEVCASLLRSCQPQPLQAWAADLMLVLDAAHNANVDPFDWLRSKGIHQRLSTMTVQKDWPDRLHAAKQWDAKGRPKAVASSGHRKPIVNTPIRQMTMQESDEELRAMGIDPDEIPF